MKRLGERRLIAGMALAVAASALLLLLAYGRGLWYPVYVRLRGRRTVADIIDRYGPAAEARLTPRFAAAGVAYPPDRAALVALKRERALELWADAGHGWQLIHVYPILAASGGAGPKLREGDRQVPEGVYRVEALNPNSSYHLSLRLNYPNEFDTQMTAQDGRADPGSDIFIHGGARSIGCVAIGDPAIEELFVLVARLWPSDIKVIIAPNDVRGGEPAEAGPLRPEWLPELHGLLRVQLASFDRGAPHASLGKEAR